MTSRERRRLPRSVATLPAWWPSVRYAAAAVLLALPFLLNGCGSSAPPADEVEVSEALGDSADEGFARATQVRRFQFPRDHGPHPAFRNEWWYITGNLEAEDGHRFGFQITFFRIALSSDVVESPSAWRTNQVWMAHAALGDFSAGTHRAEERFARQGAGLAGASAEPFRVWLEDWRLQAVGEGGDWRLRAPAEGFDLELTLSPVTPVVLQGEQGLSRKSAAPGNASYYYSIPRLGVRGRIRRGGDETRVGGLAWLDREWSTSALGPEQAGWDWFALHLQDGRDLMYYQLRRKDGSLDAHSGGSASDAGGLRRCLHTGEVALSPVRYWRSGNRRYPVEWRFHLQGEPGPWRVRALLDDQEMRLGVRYWEGAVEVVDEADGSRLGRGYLEMAGDR
jgi:predicted secreted hydrolase